VNKNNLVTSGFRRGVNEIFVLLGCYAAKLHCVTSQKNEDLKNNVLYEEVFNKRSPAKK
jgi:hypothetical protein